MAPIRHKMMSPAAWYDMLDPGIRFAVKVLHACGIETGQSCQGGGGHAYHVPTVDLWEGSGSRSGAGFAALHALEQYGLDVARISLVWSVDRGLPFEHFWRIELRRAHEDRADEDPIFTWGYVAGHPQPDPAVISAGA